ncbi:MAG: outer membrane beta-barrel protein [Deltaproteobacteria bacterium]|jgi:hypothetical protein
MNNTLLLTTTLLTLVSLPVHAQTTFESDVSALDGVWQVGLNFGELPFGGSFKLGFDVGYHFNDLVYVGFTYQIADDIQRDGSSFNANAVGFGGLLESSEEVGQRAYLQTRIRPHRLSPYVSLGVVFNDRDTETMRFDARSRQIGSSTYDGAVTLVQSRPAGLRPAIGLGYAYAFDFGLSIHAEWSGWWMFGAPSPQIDVQGVALSDADRRALVARLTDEFQSSPFNTYHVFQLGAGYVF